jgi:hypothetical protein
MENPVYSVVENMWVSHYGMPDLAVNIRQPARYGIEPAVYTVSIFPKTQEATTSTVIGKETSGWRDAVTTC